MLAWVAGLALIFASLAIPFEALAQRPYQPPRTADGHPDLQGVWTSRWLTPLERPQQAANLVLPPDKTASFFAAMWERADANDPLGPLHSWDIEGLLTIRGEVRSSLVIDPDTGQVPYTEEGRARRKGLSPNIGFDGPEQRSSTERCLGSSSGMAPFMTTPAGNFRQIVQTSDHLVFYTEAFNDRRIVPLNGEQGAGSSRGGASIGRWEKDTLVVETSGFDPADRLRYAISSIFPITPGTRIVERFDRISDDEILYRFTVEDPLIFTRPWTGESLMKRSSERMYEWTCHEGNYGLAGILSGARVAEERAAIKKAKQ